MTAIYPTDAGVPIPVPERGFRTPESLTMNTMPVGHSFPIESHRVNAARCAVRLLRPKKFVVRKTFGGWRVWRTE